MRKRFLLIIIIILVKFFPSQGQDFHYSQFYNEPINFNPSLTGIFEGDKRLIFSLRDQYRSVPVPYFTMSGSYDVKFNPKIPKKGIFSAGVLFNYDKQGDSKITLFNLNLSGSYSYFLNRKNIITLGALVGYSNRGFDEGELKWYNNWNSVTGVYDPREPSNENFEAFRFSYIESGLGLNYRYQYAPRTNIMLGGSLFHLLTPDQNWEIVTNDQLGMRLSLVGILNLKLADPLDIQIDLLHQQQDVYKETIVGGLLKLYLNNKISKKFAVHGGVLFRLGEGFGPKLAFEYNEWYVGMNYDIVTKTSLSDITNRRGGPEVHVRYTITNVKPLGHFKICPIY